MAIRGAVPRLLPPLAVARLALAAALTAGSFLAMYVRYHDSCMIPNYGLTGSFPDSALFDAISALFVLGFVWLLFELVLSLRPGRGWGFALATALLAYAAIGAAVWLGDPTPDDKPGAEFRLVMSIDWSAGLLLEMGAFRDYSCGY